MNDGSTGVAPLSLPTTSDISSTPTGGPIQLTGKADLTDPANLVWPTSKLPGFLGGVGLTTRGVLDVAIVLLAIFLGTIGVIMLMKPDFQRLLSAAKNLPPIIPV